jgi:hypothetical protein
MSEQTPDRIAQLQRAMRLIADAGRIFARLSGMLARSLQPVPLDADAEPFRRIHHAHAERLDSSDGPPFVSPA